MNDECCIKLAATYVVEFVLKIGGLAAKYKMF